MVPADKAPVLFAYQVAEPIPGAMTVTNALVSNVKRSPPGFAVVPHLPRTAPVVVVHCRTTNSDRLVAPDIAVKLLAVEWPSDVPPFVPNDAPRLRGTNNPEDKETNLSDEPAFADSSPVRGETI